MFTQCSRLLCTNSLIGGFTTGRQEYNTELLCNNLNYNLLNAVLLAVFEFNIWHCHFCVLYATKLLSATQGYARQVMNWGDCSKKSPAPLQKSEAGLLSWLV